MTDARREPMTNVTERDREEAAGCWCTPTTSMIEMDERLAEVFAAKLAAQRETIARLEGELRDEQAKLSTQIHEYCELERAIEALGVQITDDYGALDPSEELTKFVQQLQARLTASEAAKKWTREKPTAEGEYWFRSDATKPITVSVYRAAENDLIAQIGCNDIPMDDLDAFDQTEDGEWQGPLTPGEE